MLVFVPISDAELGAWARTGVLSGPRKGYAVTTGLRRAFEVQDEAEGEQLALLVASIAALAATGKRLVVVLEATARDSSSAVDFGEVELGELTWAAVQSLFADAPDVAELAAAAAAAAGQAIEPAWNQEAVFKLLEAADLLWFGQGEWEVVIAG